MATIEVEDNTDAPHDEHEHEQPDYYWHGPDAIMVACALIGNSGDLFEIWQDHDDGMAYYYANRVCVSESTYRAAMRTMDLDRYCHSCAQADEDDDALPQGQKPEAGPS